jgi:elongation factor G
MSTHRVEDVRNIALAGHGASGKTSVADALLFKAVDRRGSVDDGTSISDFDEEEHKHHFSVDTSVLHLEHQGKWVNLLDTPGYPDFIGSALAALEAVENVLLVVSAVTGIGVNTRRMFTEAGKRGLGRLVVLNKLDGDNINLEETLATLRATFGQGCVLFNAPLNPGKNFNGVVSVLNPPATTPAGCPVNLERARTQLLDAVAESDEALTEKYLTEGNLSTEEMLAALPRALAAGTVVPVFCTAACKGKDLGIAELLDALATLTLSPTLAKPRVAQNGQGPMPVNPDPKGKFIAQVFKAVNDKFVGNLSFLRVFSGTFHPDQPLVNTRTDKPARTGSLMVVQGKTHQSVPEACAGDIVAVAKVDDLHVGDTVTTVAHGPKLPTPTFPTPMFGLAVEPKARGDEQKISGGLGKIAIEDPTFLVNRDPQTHELVMTGMSQLHLEVVQQRLKRRYDLEVVTHDPKIAYRETIQSKGEGNHKHKKQSGGRGQFAEVHLRVYPLTREVKTVDDLHSLFLSRGHFDKLRAIHYDPTHNFAFLDTIVGGTIPNQFVPAVEKGCKELLDRGALAGFRTQDVVVEVHFGKYHDVDSSEAAFKTAGRIAFKNAVLSAHPLLLEPMVHLEVTVPTRFTGAILGDMNTKRARIEHQDSLPGDLAVIKALAPLAEVTRYAAQLGSITQGQGSYTMELSHYDPVPANVQQQIVSKAKVTSEEDE